MATPHYANVPETWKAGPPHFGMYRQAPAEFGGEWWFISPFNQKPWLTLVPKKLPPGFLETFGPEPPKAASHWQEWHDNLRDFKQAGVPPGVDPAKIEQATQSMVAWGMGKPAFYEGRYGWAARFPEQMFWDFDAPGVSWLGNPDWKIAEWQSRMIAEGVMPEKIHPYVPHHILPKEKQENPT